ncbi:MAG: ABC transporter permease [Anaerolineae bacterium]|nr:ABC transporter permease [Anaerolineae bacterium]
MRNRSFGIQLAFTVLPIIISLAIAALLVLLVGKNPIEVFEKIWEGAFRNSRSFSSVLNFWIPLTLVSLGLVVTFRAGLWNIGIEGQMMVGAIFASWAAQYVTVSPELAPLLIALELVLAVIGGMFWATIVGLLKIRLGVNEIFGGIALNALADVAAIYLISGPWQPEIGGSAQGTEPFPAEALLPELSPDLTVSLLVLVLVVLVIIALPLALRGTRWGLQLKATGRNPKSSLLLGVPTSRTMLSAFLVCGGLAGIAGAYRVLFTFDNMRPLVSGGIGFLGLLIGLLVSTRVLLVPLVAFAFAAILAGSTRLKIALQLDASLSGVLQGTMVLLVLLFNGLRQRMEERFGAAPAESDPVTTAPPASVSREVLTK